MSNIIDMSKWNAMEHIVYSDEEILRMIVGGSLVAFSILLIAYLIYITNLTFVLQYFKRKITEILLPNDSKFLQIVIYLQIILFIAGCLLQRSKTISFLSVYGPPISSGQFFRFFSSSLIHADVFHLYNNIRGLKNCGVLLENSIGLFKFVILFLVSNTAGGVISFYWSPLSHSFGAHGVVFGILGALLYIYYFKAKLWKVNGKEDMSEFQNEVIMFIARYFLFGILLDRIAFFSNLCSFILGFILSMALCGDFSHKRKQIMIGGTFLFLFVAIFMTQMTKIHDLDLELKYLEKCRLVAEEKTSSFLTNESLNIKEYSKKRNLAYEVRNYVLPIWESCHDDALKLKNSNYPLVKKQKELLDKYIKIFNASYHLWKFYSNIYEEEVNEILLRDIKRKNEKFIAKVENFKKDYTWKLDESYQFPYLDKIWKYSIGGIMLFVLFVKTFPNLSISKYVIQEWNYLILFIVTKLVK